MKTRPEVEWLFERKNNSQGVFYRVKVVGESAKDSQFKPAESIPLRKRYQFEEEEQAERRRVYPADSLKIMINTRHKAINHFVNGDLVTQVLGRSKIGNDHYLVKWNRRKTIGSVSRDYLEKYHFELLFDFQKKEMIKKSFSRK